MAAELAFAATFLGFCALSGHQIYKRGKGVLSQYRQSVAQQFDEAESLLKEAQNLLDQAKRDKESLDIKTQEILDLAHSEASFLLEKRKEDIQEAQANYDHFFQQQSCVIARQWKKKASMDLWGKIADYLEKLSQSRDHSQDIKTLIHVLEAHEKIQN
jgi:F0F1-type ATP synthase membrane subunit b/b'